MPKLPRWTSLEAERARLSAGFQLLRAKGSHRIYGRDVLRVMVPFHSGAIPHPKIIKQALETIQEAGQSTATEG